MRDTIRQAGIVRRALLGLGLGVSSAALLLAGAVPAEAAKEYVAYVQVKPVYSGDDHCTKLRGNHGQAGGNQITRCAGKGRGKGALTYYGQSAALVQPGCKVEANEPVGIRRHDFTPVNRRAVRVWMDLNLWRSTNLTIFCGYSHA